MFMLVQFFIPHPVFKSIYKEILNWARVIGVFAIVIGVGTTGGSHADLLDGSTA